MRKILFIVFCLIWVSQPSIAQSLSPHTWELCIGIAEYDQAEIALKWADKDAIDFSNFLRVSLGIPVEQYRIIKNSDATKKNILEAFGWLNMFANTGDRVYIFYSGHGRPESPIIPW